MEPPSACPCDRCLPLLVCGGLLHPLAPSSLGASVRILGIFAETDVELRYANATASELRGCVLPVYVRRGCTVSSLRVGRAGPEPPEQRALVAASGRPLGVAAAACCYADVGCIAPGASASVGFVVRSLLKCADGALVYRLPFKCPPGLQRLLGGGLVAPLPLPLPLRLAVDVWTIRGAQFESDPVVLLGAACEPFLAPRCDSRGGGPHFSVSREAPAFDGIRVRMAYSGDTLRRPFVVRYGSHFCACLLSSPLPDRDRGHAVLSRITASSGVTDLLSKVHSDGRFLVSGRVATTSAEPEHVTLLLRCERDHATVRQAFEIPALADAAHRDLQSTIEARVWAEMLVKLLWNNFRAAAENQS
eukprot:m51a1_g8523 hypothetical protein (361) ;mRNA; f:116550-117938